MAEDRLESDDSLSNWLDRGFRAVVWIAVFCWLFLGDILFIENESLIHHSLAFFIYSCITYACAFYFALVYQKRALGLFCAMAYFMRGTLDLWFPYDRASPFLVILRTGWVLGAVLLVAIVWFRRRKIHEDS